LIIMYVGCAEVCRC